jgi:phosphoglycolate phosphatase
MKYKAVIFDLDGTLLDTVQDVADSMNSALKSMGCKVHEISEYRYLMGDGIDTLAMRALPDNVRDEEHVMKCISIFQPIYKEGWGKTTRPYDGIIELLAELKSKNIRTAVLSNKSHEFTERMVHYFFNGDYFSEIRGAMPSIPKKPDPTAAREIAKRLSLAPSQILYIGDTGIDMETAVRAGMYPLGVLWGYRDDKELLDYGAKMLMKTPRDLLELIQSDSI